MMHRFTLHRFFAWTALLFAIAFGGCSKPGGELTGLVTFKGKAFSNGDLVVVGSSGIPLSGSIRKDGTYQLLNIPVEPIRIAVVETSLSDSSAGRIEEMYKRIDEGKDAEEAKEQFLIQERIQSKKSSARTKLPLLPASYGDPNRSGIVYEMKQGRNQFNIEMK